MNGTRRAQPRPRAARGATNPARGLDPAGLAAMSRADLRIVVLALLSERGIAVVEISERGEYDEFVLNLDPGLRVREGRCRIFRRTITRRDLDEFARLAAQSALSEAIAIEVAERPGTVRQPPAGVHLIGARELIDRFEDSAAIGWDGPVPKPDRDVIARLRALRRAPQWVDQLGLRAVTILARNKLPPELEGVGEPPDEMFERLTFRLFTHVFRFGGSDLGARERGTRAPDALLECPRACHEPFSAVLDCKASRDAWSMDADDETRLANYVDSHRGQLLHGETPFLIVVSSAFAGGTTAFTNRRAAIAARCGAQLVYLRAGLLVKAALALEEERASCEAREGLPWHSYLANGRPAGDIAILREDDR